MNNGMLKGVTIMLMAVMIGLFAVPSVKAYADTEPAEKVETTVTESDPESEVKESKATAAAITIAVVAAIGAISMGIAIAKSVDGIARQPEAEGKIRTTLMLGLVFIETAIIYALIVAILIIFVL